MRKGLFTWVFWAKIPFGGWKGFVIDEWGSYAFSCVTPITVWVVSKNESNCLSENKMVSILIWRHVSLLYVVQSNILWLTILLSYHTDIHVTLYLQIIDFQFPSCCTSQSPKKLNQIITVNSSTNTPRSYPKKITLARSACLCFFHLLYFMHNLCDKCFKVLTLYLWL